MARARRHMRVEGLASRRCSVPSVSRLGRFGSTSGLGLPLGFGVLASGPPTPPQQCLGEALVDERDATVTAPQVAALPILVLTRLDVGERIQRRLAEAVLLDEPDLVALEDVLAVAAAEQARVVSGEDQLCAARVRLRVLEEPEEAGGEQGVEAGVDLVHDEGAPPA